MHYSMRSRRACLTIAMVAFVSGGCAKSSENAIDSASESPAVAATTTDTGMAGMDHSKMAGMDRAPAKDADHEFLRMMTDHHEGMVQMASAAMTRGSPAVRDDAQKLSTKQADEQKRMAGMVQTTYGEAVMPMIMPSNREMIDLLAAKSGADYDRAFYASVIAHHREAIKMVDDMMPRLASPEVKRMAEMMKADQQKEIIVFEKKLP